MLFIKSWTSAFKITAGRRVNPVTRRDMALEWTQMANWSRMRDHTRKAVNPCCKGHVFFCFAPRMRKSKPRFSCSKSRGNIERNRPYLWIQKYFPPYLEYLVYWNEMGTNVICLRRNDGERVIWVGGLVRKYFVRPYPSGFLFAARRLQRQLNVLQ